jgi:hypothetical protein
MEFIILGAGMEMKHLQRNVYILCAICDINDRIRGYSRAKKGVYAFIE